MGDVSGIGHSCGIAAPCDQGRPLVPLVEAGDLIQACLATDFEKIEDLGLPVDHILRRSGNCSLCGVACWEKWAKLSHMLSCSLRFIKDGDIGTLLLR